MDFDFLSSLLDEVALEGLDGITLSMLWVRLQNRPNFPIALDDDSKVFLWECIAVHKDIEIFQLPKARVFVPLYNRYEYIDNELGIVLEPTEKIIDSYPIVPVKDGDIRGSCATYKSRTCITSEIRYDDVLLMSLGQVNEKWGEKLVLVASPKARLLALIGTETNPLIELSQEEYCLLERIGRSRYYGEVTQGEGGLLSLKAPFCKQLHYYRKKLTLKGLVTKQLHYLKSKKGQAITGSLFHLTRFFIQRKTKMELLMKCMCDVLKEKPGNRETCKTLRAELNIKEGTFKKLFHKPFQKWVKIVNMAYKEFKPEAQTKEMYTLHGQDRMLKVVQLLKHCDEVDNDDEGDTSEEKESALPLNVHFDCSKVYYDLPLLTQIYRLIQEAGPEGLSAAEIGRLITLPKLDIRTLLKNLLKRDLVVTLLQEKGRQKETRYIAKNFGEQNEAYSNVKKEVNKFTQDNFIPNIQKKRKISDLQNATSASHVVKKVRFDASVKETAVKNLNQLSSAESEQSCKKLDENCPAADENFNKIDFQKITYELSELQSCDSFTGKSPRLIDVTEKIDDVAPASKFVQMTYRKVKRINMLLGYLKKVKYSTLADLQKYLCDEERKEGYNFKIDKKSTARILNTLYKAKEIKIFKAVLKLDHQKAEIEFICDNSQTTDDPSFQVAIDQAKFRFFSISKDINKQPDKSIEPATISNDKCLDENKESEINPEERNFNFSTYQKTLQDMQVTPKFLRLKALHKFLFYLVYQYEGHSGDNSQDPVVYHDSMSWKRFVPPLPSNHKEGWCFLADVFNRMPLSVFVKVMNLRQKIREFGDYLTDEIKCHYLITYLPKDKLKSLLIKRKYLFSCDEVLKYLCFMGLISNGPRVSNLKDQTYLYVHKNIALKDTTISAPGYLYVNPNLAYEKKIFTLSAMEDVEKFWVELEHIASCTPLGKYSTAAGKTIAIAPAMHKPMLLEMLKNKNFDEVSDVGYIPGDGLGAGGFDSSLFLHSRRNWHSINLKDWGTPNKNEVTPQPVISIQNLLKDNAVLGPEKPSRLQRLGQHNMPSQRVGKEIKKNKSEVVKNEFGNSKPLSSQPVLPKKRKNIKFRTIKVREKKMRTPYYDEKDKVAMEKMAMSRTRCDWSAQEDSFLLLCKVASSFLDPSASTIVVPYTVIRDLLHEHYPDIATNKSSRACQRRVRYMMLNPTTTNNVAVFLGEAKQDVSLVKEFDKAKPLKTNEAAWKEIFTRTIRKLLEKFTLPAEDRCKHISLPETMEMLKSKYNVIFPRNEFNYKSNHKNPDSEEELKYCILYSLVVSAMAIKHEETEWSYLLYKLYHEYPEHVLRSVVSQLRSEKVIACKKSKCKRDFKPSNMTTFPYRFSITYENALLTKFPIKLFNESKELLDKFKDLGSEKSVNLRDDVPPGYLPAILSLISLDDITLSVKIPEQIILFDTSLSKEARSNIFERMMHSLNNNESDELSRILNEKDFPLHIVNPDNENQNEDQLSDEIGKKSDDVPQSNEIQPKTNASRFALYLLRQELSQPPIERVQHSQDYIVLNTCQVKCHLKSPVCSEGALDNSQGTASLQKNKNDARGKILTDGCLSEIKASLTAFIPPEAFTQYQNFDESLEMIYDAYSPQTLSDAKHIFNDIFETNTIGISEKELWGRFRFLNGELSLFEHLHLFREALLVLRAGVASFIYVCISFAKNWLLKSYILPEFCFQKKIKAVENENCDLGKNEDDGITDASQETLQPLQVKNADLLSIEDSNPAFPDNFMDDFSDDTSHTENLSNPSIHFTDEVYFLPRTWRNPDGTLNKKVFIELLQTVLSYIVHSPGVNTSRVIDRFALVLQPVQTLELMEILEKACCIIKYYCKKSKKVSLFSSQATFFITKNPEPEDLDHIEPLSNALCNLARIQEAVM